MSARGFIVSLICLVALAAPGSGVPGSADPSASSTPRVLHLRSGTLTGPGDHAGLPLGLLLDRSDLDDGGPALLRFRGRISPQVRHALDGAGIRPAGHLGDGGLLVWLPPGGLDRTVGLPDLDWAAPYHPGLKIAPGLAAMAEDDPRGLFPVTLHLFAGAPFRELVRRIGDLGLEVTASSPGRPAGDGLSYRPARIVLRLSPTQWSVHRDALARYPEVFWIERRPVYRLLNDDSVWVGQSGLDANRATPVHDRGLLGDGEVVAVLDTGIDADMCYFRDGVLGLPPTNLGLGYAAPDPLQRKVSIVNFLWLMDDPADPADWDSQDHGTHVAGSVAGDDLASPGTRDPGDGMAPAAKLVIQDGGYAVDDCADMPAIGCPAADLYPFFNQAYLQGARIHSNSYGDRENFTPYNIYSDGSEAADSFMWDHPEMLLVFAAGNNGPGLATVASPATGKNVLAVGATNPGASADGLASFSSQGPTHDNRIKPDVTIPGSGIISADNDNDIGSNNCSTRSMSGTSMAAPTAAGLAALVREYYAKGYYPSGVATPADQIAPSAALVKATLIASAAPMEGVTSEPPSGPQGWGRILLDDALYFPGDTRRIFVADAAARFSSPSDPEDVYTLDVIDGSEPLRVVLNWTDYPSTPVAVTNLVNDLNLEVESPSGVLYLGNVFLDGASLPGGTADDVNNVEAVRIDSPQSGTWTVRVKPASLPEPAQGYALVATGRMPARGVFLEHAALLTDDSVGGNGNGLMEPGEWIDLPLDLLNSGDTVATNIRVQMESLTAGVEVWGAETLFTDLDQGESAAGSAPHLRIRLAAGQTCNSSLTLRLHYLADGYQRNEEITLPTGVDTVIASDDLEGVTGWQHQAGESTATTGDWILGDPDGTGFQPEDDATPAPGLRCLFTAWNFGGAGSDDVDDGVVVARSGAYDLSGHPEARLRISRWFGNRDRGEDSGDFFRLHIRENELGSDHLLEELDTNVSAPVWTEVGFRVADYVTPGPDVELKVSVADGVATGNIIEAAIDEIVFWEPACQVYDPAPNTVETLAAIRSGSDVDLSWSRPVLDPLHGEAVRYGVHRSETPTGGWVLRDELFDSSLELSSTDSGGATGPALYFYQVIAGNDAGDAEPLP